jgi:hypothetical protein
MANKQITVLENEKAYNLREKGFITISVPANSKINKVTIKQLLTKAGYKSLKVNSISSNIKIKRRGKQASMIPQKSNRKFCIKFEDASTIDTEKLTEIFNS